MIELAGIIILGIFSQWIAWKVRVPSILPLIISGLLVGPLSTLFTDTGEKLLNPIYDPGTGKGLFPGEYLFSFVSLAIGIILFEGGLTLKRSEIKGVGPAILKLVTMGSAITFLGGGFATHYIMELNWPVSFMFSGLVVVTGPTVIAPILRNLPLTRNVATVLKWESILIDPIGALLAVLVFEFIISSGGVSFTSMAMITFLRVILVGMALGAISGWALFQFIRRNWIPSYLLNVFTLAFVLGVFVMSNVVAQESGLLSVVVMGTVMGNLDIPRFREILLFKESLSVLLISILFILLSAQIDLEELLLVFSNWRSFVLFGFLVFVLRPLGVIICTKGSDLKTAEKLFISWVGPRGIVAAGIASLFGATLTRMGIEDAEYITPMVFMVVMGTVLLIALTVRPVAKGLGVCLVASRGILIVGANQAARLLAKYLKDNQRHVVLVDSNEGSIRQARAMGLEAIPANMYSDDLAEQIDLADMGFLLAMTSSVELNQFAVTRYEKEFGENGAFRLISAEELKKLPEERPRDGLLSYTDDFLNLNEVVRDFPFIHEKAFSQQSDLVAVMAGMGVAYQQIPVFVKDSQGEVLPIPFDLEHFQFAPGVFYLVYLGKKLED
ncbi:MAG: sodium:proton antiporter [Haliscomenobacter sp.]|nr:sodium:proton antiporter [Haliscomenobacter sp.]